MGQVGSGENATATLFHEGGHAAHMLNTDQREVCLNHEYAPMSTAWAETQSMFMDTIFSSIEWCTRYAKDKDGNPYPFDLYERRVRKLSVVSPLGLRGMTSVMTFEKALYEAKVLSRDSVLKLAQNTHRHYFDYTDDTVSLLNIPHLYSWESSCAYHGYALATLALNQWRDYFYKKYDYIVDNPNAGKEMSKVWKLGASKAFPELIKIATGKPLSAKAYLANVTRPVDEKLKLAKKRIKRLEAVKAKHADLNASIKLVHGKKTIATNAKGIDVMCKKYASWLESETKKS
jgi:oligoendopeptidase F